MSTFSMCADSGKLELHQNKQAADLLRSVKVCLACQCASELTRGFLQAAKLIVSTRRTCLVR